MQHRSTIGIISIVLYQWFVSGIFLAYLRWSIQLWKPLVGKQVSTAIYLFFTLLFKLNTHTLDGYLLLKAVLAYPLGSSLHMCYWSCDSGKNSGWLRTSIFQRFDFVFNVDLLITTLNALLVVDHGYWKYRKWEYNVCIDTLHRIIKFTQYWIRYAIIFVNTMSTTYFVGWEKCFESRPHEMAVWRRNFGWGIWLQPAGLTIRLKLGW
jgi:hypothetical protein